MSTPRKGTFAKLALIGAVLAAALVAVVLVRVSEQTEFDRRRARAERLEAQAASTDKQELIVSPQSWILHEWTADRASRIVSSSVWDGVGVPSAEGPAEASFINTEDSTFMGTHEAGGSSPVEPIWYLMETDPMTQGAFELHISSPWILLDEYPNPAPQLVGTEDFDGEQLDRFDVFIPAEKFEWPGWVRVGGIGFGGVEQRNGIEASFWFAPEGELRHLIVTGEGDDGLYSYEYSSRLSTSPASLEAPTTPRSWAEFVAATEG